MISYDDLTTFCMVFFSICGGIVLLSNTWTSIKKLKKPADDLHETVERHTKLLDSDKKKLDSLCEENKIICHCMLALINHEISGNDISGLKKVREELQNHLIDR